MSKNLIRFTSFLAAALAGLAFAGAAQAQPRPESRPHMAPHHAQVHQAPKRHKVWVPAHREHGRMVRAHYVWR